MTFIGFSKKHIKKNKKKIKFIFTGGINTVFGLSLYPFLSWLLEPLNIHYLIILMLCQFVSIMFAYLTYKLFVFQTQGNIFSEFLKFSSFYLSIFLVNLIVLPLFVEVFKAPIVFTQFIFTFVVIVLSYFWHSKISFLGNN